VYQVETLRTRDRAPGERGDWWRHQVCSIHCPMSLALPEDYHGMIQHQRSGHYQLVRWWGDAETVTRGTTQIRRDSRDCYELLVPVRGEMSLRQDDITLTAGPSSMILTSLSCAFDLRHGDGFSCLALVVPRARLEPRLTRAARRAGLTLDAGRGLGAIVADQIRSLRSHRDQLSGAGFDAVADRLTDILALACNGVTTSDSPSLGGDLVQSIRRFIRENAHDPELTGAQVAAGLGWSLRHVQVQLQRIGTTVSELIREERLALARLRLQDPSWRQRSITEIGLCSGFGDPSTFSNAYRRRFGERPSDTREEEHHCCYE
jgi:AraC-like DNA-binding protein